MRNDPRISRWCRQSDLISELDQEGWYEKQNDDAAISMYVIAGPSDTPVGVCGLTSIDLVSRRAEFSLYIDPEKQGSGFGKMALSMLLDKAFKDLNLNLVWGETFDENPALAIFEKLGFTKDGYRRDFYFKDGKYLGATLISITAAEWTYK